MKHNFAVKWQHYLFSFTLSTDSKWFPVTYCPIYFQRNSFPSEKFANLYFVAVKQTMRMKLHWTFKVKYGMLTGWALLSLLRPLHSVSAARLDDTWHMAYEESWNIRPNCWWLCTAWHTVKQDKHPDTITMVFCFPLNVTCLVYHFRFNIWTSSNFIMPSSMGSVSIKNPTLGTQAER